MKLAGAKASGYFAKPDPSHYGILIYGADTMRVALRRKELVTAIVGPNGEEEMRLTRLNAADLRKEPAGLIDGIKAQGFFPGPVAVTVEETTDALTPVIAAALEAWAEGDATLIVSAGSLTAKSKLRKLFEAGGSTMAIGLYNDPPGRDEIAAALKKAGLEDVPNDVMQDVETLARSLEPGDFQQTIEKLGLYMLSAKDPLSANDLAACAPATSDAGMDDAIHAVADGNHATVGLVLSRLFGQGVSPVGLCIATLRHFRVLHAAASHSDGPEAALSRARPPVFGPRRDRMIRQARSWGVAKLERALKELTDTDLALRSAQKGPDAALVERAFLRVSMINRRR